MSYLQILETLFFSVVLSNNFKILDSISQNTTSSTLKFKKYKK